MTQLVLTVIAVIVLFAAGLIALLKYLDRKNTCPKCGGELGKETEAPETPVDDITTIHTFVRICKDCQHRDNRYVTETFDKRGLPRYTRSKDIPML